MELTHWLSLLTICVLGATMPGPSLAVVVQNTLRGGAKQGVVTALSHACGVGIYALLTAMGLAVLIKASPTLFVVIQVAGALFLIYLGLRALIGGPKAEQQELPIQTTRQSLSGGFLTAFLNPKLAIFFTALFSQFVHESSTWLEKGVMVATTVGVDAGWYCLVAFLLTRGVIKKRFSGGSKWIEKIFGVVLVALGLRLIINN